MFYLVQLRTPSPLIEVQIFRIRAFLVENIVLAISMTVFVPVFFFASEYAQISLGDSASQAGLYLLYFFIGFAVAAQVGGRLLDRRGPKLPVSVGCVLAAVGFSLWAGNVAQLKFGNQVWDVIIAGAGVGLILGPASTDAVNRASRRSYGEATGITQTVRNYAASLGLAILGTVQVTVMRSRVKTSLVAQGLGKGRASKEAASISQSRVGQERGVHPPFHPPRLCVRDAHSLVRHGGDHGRCGRVAFVGLERGLQAREPAPEQPAEA